MNAESELTALASIYGMCNPFNLVRCALTDGLITRQECEELNSWLSDLLLELKSRPWCFAPLSECDL